MLEALNLTTLLGLGFILGLSHTLEIDHLVAISTMVSQTKNLKKSSLLGAVWGIGHTTTLFMVGMAILIFKLTVPNKLAWSFEFLGGIILVILGIDLLRKIIRDNVHIHKHKHRKLIHIHFHPHGRLVSHNHIHKPFIVGIMHGLAGSAALMLLILTTLRSVFLGLLYILVFGVGTIVGMSIASGIIRLPFILTSKSHRIHNSIRIFACITSIVLGFVIMYETGFVSGLFV